MIKNSPEYIKKVVAEYHSAMSAIRNGKLDNARVETATQAYNEAKAANPELVHAEYLALAKKRIVRGEAPEASVQSLDY